jgi:hypothetical protein
MLYKFKSKVTGDLIMLEPDAKRLLKIMGREDQIKGIFLAEQIPTAMAALEEAIQAEADAMAKLADMVEAGSPSAKHVSLKQRSMPMLKMLQSCKDQSADVVWGV